MNRLVGKHNSDGHDRDPGAQRAGWGAASDGWKPSMLIEVSGLGGAYRGGSVETPAVGYNGSRWEAFIASLVRFVRQNYLQEHSSA
jgi:hypothetical protein